MHQTKTQELRGKAAQIRSLIPVLIKVWSANMNVNNDQHRDVLTGLVCSARIDTLLEEHRGKPRLPPLARKEFRDMCFEFVSAQASLVAFYHPTIPLHNIATKTHYPMHLGMIADFMNPSQGFSNTTDCPWTDHRDGIALWQLKMWTNIAYAAAHPNRHRVLRHVPGVGINNYCPDIMHSKHLGSDKSFVGSALRNLTHHILPGDFDGNLSGVWRQIKAEYGTQKTPTRFQNLTHRMIQGASNKNSGVEG